MANNGIFNNYTVQPKNIATYKARRGIMDFTQLGAFDQFETGYSYLAVLKMPKFMEVLAKERPDDIGHSYDAFKYMLEYEFRGLSGLPDYGINTMTLTDGANEALLINDVTYDTSASVSMTFVERRGSLITKFSEYYLTGIKDPKSKAKTYHGLIKDGKLEPSLENEVFTMLYMVTDNTMLALERAVLLCNCQLTKAETSTYDSERGQISNKEMSVEFNCLPLMGFEVDRAANKLLADITGTFYNSAGKDASTKYNPHDINNEIPAALDSAEYRFGIMETDPAVLSDKIGTGRTSLPIFQQLAQREQ